MCLCQLDSGKMILWLFICHDSLQHTFCFMDMITIGNNKNHKNIHKASDRVNENYVFHYNHDIDIKLMCTIKQQYL